MFGDPPQARVDAVELNPRYGEWEAAGAVTAAGMTVGWTAWLPWPWTRWEVEVDTTRVVLDEAPCADWTDAANLLEVPALKAAVRAELGQRAPSTRSNAASTAPTGGRVL